VAKSSTSMQDPLRATDTSLFRQWKSIPPDNRWLAKS
jgi:hypothetical protein